ncbi:TauD/TfdA family dioxygenase [Kitasatospora sp. NPDC057940]|uniref:TauD/TfdA family dioxygenase n=1 Tax=Kitasatospora sp. NPDC057940 TaxID=3346285 RepID=UPI0036DE10EF
MSFLEESGTVQPVATVPDRAERADWLLAHRPELRRLTLRHGSLRLVGAAVASTDELAGVAAALGGGALEYTERSTPRSRVAGSVYTSTEYPADQRIPQHNESSYSSRWPDHLFFLATRTPHTGGQTPVADSRAVLARLPAELVEKFSALGVRYTRAYHDGIGLSWQEAFQTEDRGHIESYCRDNGIAWEWEGDLLRTSQVRPALTRHPVTGETVWFNQAHLFHIGSLPARTTEALLAVFPEQNLPRNAYFGDGSPIDADTLAEIHAAFDRTTLAPDWTQGDVMVVDNILASHGRAPYQGDRTVLVTMTSATWPDWPAPAPA